MSGSLETLGGPILHHAGTACPSNRVCAVAARPAPQNAGRPAPRNAARPRAWGTRRGRGSWAAGRSSTPPHV
eukprot:12356594-Alexandrium_andersonii.AAC.1